ncbi:MAG TPA: hypothetical protein VN832_00510 [Stellaceae bacterium]|nr:hypothetical protein [Stellaceae bacterium]
MTKLAWLPLLFLSLPAFGQTDKMPQSEPPGTARTIAPSRDIMLHHQPTPGIVDQRETQQFGAPEVHRVHTKEQSEIDDIYADVMRRSNPPEAK